MGKPACVAGGVVEAGAGIKWGSKVLPTSLWGGKTKPIRLPAQPPSRPKRTVFVIITLRVIKDNFAKLTKLVWFGNRFGMVWGWISKISETDNISENRETCENSETNIREPEQAAIEFCGVSSCVMTWSGSLNLMSKKFGTS